MMRRVPVLRQDDMLEVAAISSLTSGTISSPPATASAPPGQKSFCTSMTISASRPWHTPSAIVDGAQTSMDRAAASTAFSRHDGATVGQDLF